MFKVNSSFWDWMTRIGNIILISVLYFFFSLPLISIPAASMAVFSVVQLNIITKESGIIKPFLENFIKYFKSHTFTGCIFLLQMIMVVLLIFKLSTDQKTYIQYLNLILILMLVVEWLVLLYYIPLLANLKIKAKYILIWAFYLAIRYLPWTILLFLILVTLIFISTQFLPFIFFTIGTFIFIDCWVVNKLYLYSQITKDRE